MAWVKINLNGTEIELTPAVMSDALTQIKSQAGSLTIGEMADIVRSLHIPLSSLMKFIRGD